jgi:peptidoglycan/LPS O-acetylase OafA/YrhL
MLSPSAGSINWDEVIGPLQFKHEPLLSSQESVWPRSNEDVGGHRREPSARCSKGGTVAVAKNFALEGLRGMASLNVVIGHFLFVFFPYLGNDIRPYPGLAAKYWFEEVLRFPPFTFFYPADAAVSVFFVLSGYVLTQNFYETGRNEVLRAAASKRYLRLVLPALVSVIFAWLLLDLAHMQTNWRHP